MAANLRSPLSMSQLQLVANFLLRQGSQRSFQTSSVVLKRKPKSVPIPRWAQALQKRQKLNDILKKPTSERRLAAEKNLEDDKRELFFYTSATKPVEGFQNRLNGREGPRPKLMISSDKQMIIAYHPRQDFPVELTTEVPKKSVWFMTEAETQGYSDTLTDSQAGEAKRLISKDPNVWSLRAVSHLLHVTPEAIKKVVKITNEQRQFLQAEKDMLDEMPPVKRIEYRKLKLWEIVNYAKETRGLDFALDMRKRMLYRAGFS